MIHISEVVKQVMAELEALRAKRHAVVRAQICRHLGDVSKPL